MAAPTKMPAPQGPCPSSPAAAMPGATSEKALAASMTPAPKPYRLSCTFCGRVWANSTGSVPSAHRGGGHHAAQQPGYRGARTSR